METIARLRELLAAARWYAVTLDGIDEYDTPEEARASAQEAIDNALGDEWDEQVENVEWGRLIPVQQAEQFDYREPVDGKTPDGDDWPNAEWSFMCNYRLAPAADIAAAVNALPALLDRLEAAEAVVEAAREVIVHGSGTGEWTAADEVRGDALVYALDDALRRYDGVRR